MNLAYAECQLTPLTFEQARDTLRWALESDGKAVPLEGLALCLSKSALETGRWTKIYNYNFGNRRPGSKQTAGNYTCFPICNEVINGAVHWYTPAGETKGKGGPVIGTPVAVPPGHPGSWFLSFANEYDGASQYVDFLRDRFPVAFAKMIAGDCPGYVHALKVGGYFTADEAQYLAGVQSIHREFIARLKGVPHEEVPIADHVADESERMLSLLQTKLLEDYFTAGHGASLVA